MVLEPAGLLKKCLRVTGNPLPIQTPDVRYRADEFTARLGSKFDPQARVVIDLEAQVITSQSPGTAIEFSLAIVARSQKT